jgi:hypothetical protein
MVFKGQVAKIVFNLEQLECLASGVRSQVFWAFSSKVPESVAQVAKGLGKSAQTVHYHVNELVRVGLLLGVETRQVRSRTETLYVHAARLNVDAGAVASPDEFALRAKGFRTLAKNTIEETELYYERLAQDSSVSDFSLLARDNVVMSREQFAEFRARMKAVLEEILAAQPEDGVRINVLFYARPTQGQHRKWSEGEAPSVD